MTVKKPDIQTLISDHNKKTGARLKALREVLLLSIKAVERETDVSNSTINRIEKGDTGVATGKIASLIFFYGYEYHEFFDFTQPLPSSEQLKERMKKFHEEHGSEAYKIVYKQPALIDLIEHKLLKTSLFDDWVTERDVYKYCEEELGYQYSSIHNTLALAAEKGFLKLKEGSSPKKYSRS